MNAEFDRGHMAEVHRLRTLIIEVADDLSLVEEALVAVCQDATDDNLDQRCALMELRTLVAKLKGSGRSHKPNCACPIPAAWAYCQDEHIDGSMCADPSDIGGSDS